MRLAAVASSLLLCATLVTGSPWALLGGAAKDILVGEGVSHIAQLLGFGGETTVVELSEESIALIVERVEAVVKQAVQEAFTAEYKEEAQAFVDDLPFYNPGSNDYENAVEYAKEANRLAHLLDDEALGLTTAQIWRVLIAIRFKFYEEIIRIQEATDATDPNLVQLHCGIQVEIARAVGNMDRLESRFYAHAERMFRLEKTSSSSKCHGGRGLPPCGCKVTQHRYNRRLYTRGPTWKWDGAWTMSSADTCSYWRGCTSNPCSHKYDVAWPQLVVTNVASFKTNQRDPMLGGEFNQARQAMIGLQQKYAALAPASVCSGAAVARML